MPNLTFCAISGSLRAGSYNTAAVRAAAKLVPDGVAMSGEAIGDIPLYNEDVKADGFPAAVLLLQRAIASADTVLSNISLQQPGRVARKVLLIDDSFSLN